MSLRINTLTVDARDPVRQSEFWSKVLGWHTVGEAADHRLIVPTHDRSTAPHAIPVLFLQNEDGKTVKNRWHFDLVPDDQDAEIERLEALGAIRADICQGDVSWVVMADPEGNEFCVMRSFEG
jgi:predicted enzyme related to lactoylglutathione lyase